MARVSFFIYLFFVVFGTMMPFQDSLQQRGEAGGFVESNLLNQGLALLFVVSFISLWRKHNAIVAFVQRDKFLSLFLLWTMFSVFWSPDSVVSLKRWITLFGEVIICLAALIHFKWSEEALRPLRKILMLYIPLTILAVIFVPAAIQWEFPAWRGLAQTKNNLGQIALFSIIALLVIISYHKGRFINLLHYLLLAMALMAYAGARSTTSFLVGSFLLLILGLLCIGRALGNKQIAGYYAVFVVTVISLIVGLVMAFTPEVIASFLRIFGKDLSFTGRVDLWSRVIEMTEGKILQGWGIGGFWIMGSTHLYPVHREFIWLPNQAHQGYLDILNQTGVIGITLLILMILSYLTKVPRLKKRNVWIWFFLGILIFNFQESLFFRPRHIGHFMFVFAYMALHIDLLKQQEIKSHRPIQRSLKRLL